MMTVKKKIDFKLSRKKGLTSRLRTTFQITLTVLGMAMLIFSGIGERAFAEQKIWTLDADFDEGTLINVHHGAPYNDRLQFYNDTVVPLPFINVACSERGTMVRVRTDTGEILGEYKTAPDGRGLDPSRTTVDQEGNVWVANRAEMKDSRGSVVKIGIVLRGVRYTADGEQNPEGEYVKLVEGSYNTCLDRDKDGFIRTSAKLANILPWPDNGDGDGDIKKEGDARVQDAQDECIQIYQRLPGVINARHVSVDGENNVWVGGFHSDKNDGPRPDGRPGRLSGFSKLKSDTGEILQSFSSYDIGCGGYGGLITGDNGDGKGVLWSTGIDYGLLRYDLKTGIAKCIPPETLYGLGVDPDNNIWASDYDKQIMKFTPDGEVMPGFPKDIPDGGWTRGLDVTAFDGNVWVADSKSHTVRRFGKNGELKATIVVGRFPTGVSIGKTADGEKNGNVWVTNRDSDNIMAIDPKTNKVVMTVSLDDGAGPYNYSDMTGIEYLRHPRGYWTVNYDSGECVITNWEKISWTERIDDKSRITVEMRTADQATGLSSKKYVQVTDGDNLEEIQGRYIEIRVSFNSEARIGESEYPILEDLTVEYSADELSVAMDIPDDEFKKGQGGYPSFDLDDSLKDPDNLIDSALVTWSYGEVPQGWTVNIDDNNVVTVTDPEDAIDPVGIIFTGSFPWNGDICPVGSDEVIYVPNLPPVLVPPGQYETCLWPPNNKEWYIYFNKDDKPCEDPKKDRCIYITVEDPDGDPVTIKITKITCDEDDPDATDPASIGTDETWLRAKKDGNGDGRVYVIHFTADDGNGGILEDSVEFRVPHDKKDYNNDCYAVDNGQIIIAGEEDVTPDDPDSDKPDDGGGDPVTPDDPDADKPDDGGGAPVTLDDPDADKPDDGGGEPVIPTVQGIDSPGKGNNIVAPQGTDDTEDAYIPLPPEPDPSPVPVPIYRFYSELFNAHHFCDEVEKDYLIKTYPDEIWKLEKTAFYVFRNAEKGTAPVYRLYNEDLKTHLFTIDENEKDTLTDPYSQENWTYEGVAFYVDPDHTDGTVPVYRMYSENLKTHLFTIDANEKNTLSAQPGWSYETIAYYVYAASD
ncbi:hypothetical protein QUF75_08955 [Desulfococcaceae bacterium HSG7]|nr:hypothetical protein [Desulfococcaceae bacterium HSG7]